MYLLFPCACLVVFWGAGPQSSHAWLEAHVLLTRGQLEKDWTWAGFGQHQHVQHKYLKTNWNQGSWRLWNSHNFWCSFDLSVWWKWFDPTYQKLQARAREASAEAFEAYAWKRDALSFESQLLVVTRISIGNIGAKETFHFFVVVGTCYILLQVKHIQKYWKVRETQDKCKCVMKSNWLTAHLEARWSKTCSCLGHCIQSAASAIGHWLPSHQLYHWHELSHGLVAPPTPPQEEQRAKQLREVWRNEAEATQVWVWNWLERGGTRNERDAESQDLHECHESQLWE